MSLFHSCSFCAVVLFFLRKLLGRNLDFLFPDLRDPLDSPWDESPSYLVTASRKSLTSSILQWDDHHVLLKIYHTHSEVISDITLNLSNCTAHHMSACDHSVIITCSRYQLMYNKYQTIFINILRCIKHITWCLLNISGYFIYISWYLYIYQFIFININWYL